MQKSIRLFVCLAILMMALVPLSAQEAITTDYVDSYLSGVPDGFGVIRVDDFSLQLLEEAPFIVDVREPNEWEEVGYIEGAVNVPVRTIAQNLDLLPADLDTPIVVYCKAGARGAIGMTALQMLGYTDVRNLAGGMDAWLAAEQPVATGAFEPNPGEGPAIDSALVAEMDNYLTNVLPQGWGLISNSDLSLQLLENPPFLLDVRENTEREAGYIDGSIHVPLREVGANLDQLPDMDTEIVVYCKGGHRGAIAMVALQALGYNVKNLAGGYDGWVAAGNPVEGAAEAPAAELDQVAVADNYLTNILQEGWGSISSADLFSQLLENPPFIIDVREQNEWDETGHIMGAVHIPLRTLADNLDLLPAQNQPIVVYCKAGARGTIGTVVLGMLGYTDVLNLTGGIDGWLASEYDVVTDYEAPEPSDMPDVDPAMIAWAQDYLQNMLPQGWGQTSNEALFTEILEGNAPFLVDVREVSEWEEIGHIEGAINVPLRTVAASLDQLPDKDTPIVVYCKKGHRGAIGTVVLGMLGYDVRNLSGGIDGWMSVGYEVVGGMEPGDDVAMTDVVLPDAEPMAASAAGEFAVEAVVSVASMDGFGTLTGDDLAGMVDDVFLLDVREVDEYAEGFIGDAINVPVREVAQHLHLLPSMDTPIVVYCSAGHRGALAQMALTTLGYENVMSLRFGLRGWTGELNNAAPSVMAGEFPMVDESLWASVDGFLVNIPAGFGALPVADFNTMMLEGEPPFILDVREATEFEGGRIEGSVNAPTRAFGDFLGVLPEDMATPIVVVGSSGHRSALALVALKMMGYDDVLSLGGGTGAWTSAGYELVTE